MCGREPRKSAMILKPNERAWAPADKPDWLIILRDGQEPPKTREQFLLKSKDLLERLVQEATPGQIEAMNDRLRDSMPKEEYIGLPSGLLDNPQTPAALMFNPESDGHLNHQWKSEIEDLLTSDQMEQEAANKEADQLTLESFLGRLV